ncbi:MAG: rhombosortase [Gammaproteobacteria bacterium]|nr:rhombosortase [Gammaproteobacteria bacterium]
MKLILRGYIDSHGFWIVLFILCFVMQLTGLEDALRFDRQQIEAGHYGLLLSAHLVHLNWGHLGLNMAGLILLALFFNDYAPPLTWLLFTLFSALFTGLGLYLFNPELHFYVGLSGVLHGLFILGAGYESRRYKKSGLLLLLLIGGKLVWEQWSGALPGSESLSGGHVVVDAHLYGAISGGVFLLLHQVIHVHNRHKDRHHDE